MAGGRPQQWAPAVASSSSTMGCHAPPSLSGAAANCRHAPPLLPLCCCCCCWLPCCCRLRRPAAAAAGRQAEGAWGALHLLPLVVGTCPATRCRLRERIGLWVVVLVGPLLTESEGAGGSCVYEIVEFWCNAVAGWRDQECATRAPRPVPHDSLDDGQSCTNTAHGAQRRCAIADQHWQQPPLRRAGPGLCRLLPRFCRCGTSCPNVAEQGHPTSQKQPLCSGPACSWRSRGSPGRPGRCSRPSVAAERPRRHVGARCAAARRGSGER